MRALRGLRFRGKVRLLSPLVPRGGVRQATVFGARVELDLSDYVQRMMYLDCFEREETRIALRHLRPGMTFVDVGANAGYFTFLAASRVGREGRVLALEPDPVLFAKLGGAVRANGLTRVTPLNVALGRAAGELPLYVPPPEHGNRAPTLTRVAGWDEVRVPVRTLDAILEEQRVGMVDLLKIDVEGFEAEVLAGASESLAAGRVRAVLCEFNRYWLGQQGTTPERVWQSLLDHGLRATGPALTAADSVVNGFFVRP